MSVDFVGGRRRTRDGAAVVPKSWLSIRVAADELGAWQELFARLGATLYHKYIIEARVGDPGVVLRSIGALV